MGTFNTLMALGPLDGRYHQKVADLTPYFSEWALIRYRILVEIKYLMALSEHPDIPELRKFTTEEINFLRSLCDLSLEDAEIVKAIETKGWGPYPAPIRHDVKSVELYLRYKLEGTSLSDVVEWVHIGTTSEDVNNIAYALMLRGAMYGPIFERMSAVLTAVRTLAEQYSDVPMLARTHGQPATPTTLGKEFNVFYHRLNRQFKRLQSFAISIKLNGSSGNYNAFVAAFPRVDWLEFTHLFAKRFGVQPFEVSEITTQIEPHDTYAELFNIFHLFNTILIDLSQDMWRYISDDWLMQRVTAGEVGSSVMPHKVNPIDVENAEGNLGMANAMLEFFSRKLPISRLQRDLSDSTVERNFGMVLGWSLLAYTSMEAGLGKVMANQEVMAAYLDQHLEVVTEGIQTVLRREKFPNAYNALKDLSRGKMVTWQDIRTFVHDLPITDAVREEIISLTPATYTGMASRLALL